MRSNPAAGAIRFACCSLLAACASDPPSRPVARVLDLKENGTLAFEASESGLVLFRPTGVELLTSSGVRPIRDTSVYQCPSANALQSNSWPDTYFPYQRGISVGRTGVYFSSHLCGIWRLSM